MIPIPQVGVALIVRANDQVLLSQRIGYHGNGLWGFPGGHLEGFETWEECAMRELAEEAGSDVQVTYPKFWTAENTRFFEEGKHYVVIFMVSDWYGGEPALMEPHKNQDWQWFDWDDLPQSLMPGIKQLLEKNRNPFNEM